MGKYHLSKVEMETIISFNAAEDTAELYTADPVWIRKLDKEELAARLSKARRLS